VQKKKSQQSIHVINKYPITYTDNGLTSVAQPILTLVCHLVIPLF